MAETLIGTIPNVNGAVRPTVGDSNWLAFVTPIPVFGEILWRVDTARGTLERLVPRRLIYGTSATFTGAGELRLSVGGGLARRTSSSGRRRRAVPQRQDPSSARLLPGD